MEKKTLVVVAYRFTIEGLLELNAEAPIFVQPNEPVAHTSIVAAWTPEGAHAQTRMSRPSNQHFSQNKADAPSPTTMLVDAENTLRS